MSGPSGAFYDWAASRLLDQLRSGDIPSPAENTDFIWEPFLTTFRGAILPGDKAVVLRLLRDPATAMWGALLSRGVPDDDVTAELVRVFRNSESIGRQIGLFHQITARSLAPSLADEMANWLDENTGAFIADQIEFFAPQETALERVRERMSKPEYANKRWVYLYSAHAAGDKMVIRAFVEPFLLDGDPRMARAAAKSLSLL